MKRKIITQNRSEGKTEIIPVLVSTLSFLSLTHALFNSYGKKKISPNSIPLSIRIAITVESPSPISNSQSSNPNIHRFFHLPISVCCEFGTLCNTELNCVISHFKASITRSDSWNCCFWNEVSQIDRSEEG